MQRQRRPLFHPVGAREIWADTVFTVVPPLAAAGFADVALAQPDGHRARLRRPDGLWRARWDEDAGRPSDDRAWGTGNGWVAAALARTVGRLPGSYAAAGRSLLATAVARVDGPGRVTGAAAAPRFDRPGHSPEAQAWLLLATLRPGRR
ncbi:hypothetical protein ACI8AA_02430 [Geodermatophilus sp. SYSU D01180]